MPLNSSKTIDAYVLFSTVEKPTYEKCAVEVKAFKTKRGDVHRIKQTRQVYVDRKGNNTLIHFVVETDQFSIFDIVYDTKKLRWYLVQELASSLREF